MPAGDLWFSARVAASARVAISRGVAISPRRAFLVDTWRARSRAAWTSASSDASRWPAFMSRWRTSVGDSADRPSRYADSSSSARGHGIGRELVELFPESTRYSHVTAVRLLRRRDENPTTFRCWTAQSPGLDENRSRAGALGSALSMNVTRPAGRARRRGPRNTVPCRRARVADQRGTRLSPRAAPVVLPSLCWSPRIVCTLSTRDRRVARSHARGGRSRPLSKHSSYLVPAIASGGSRGARRALSCAGQPAPRVGRRCRVGAQCVLDPLPPLGGVSRHPLAAAYTPEASR